MDRSGDPQDEARRTADRPGGVGRKAARARLAYAVYWLVLAVLLAYLPVLQSWEALPWDGGWSAAKLAILGLVALLPIATRHEPRRHVAVVLLLLAAGVAFLLVNLDLVGP